MRLLILMARTECRGGTGTSCLTGSGLSPDTLLRRGVMICAWYGGDSHKPAFLGVCLFAFAIRRPMVLQCRSSRVHSVAAAIWSYAAPAAAAWRSSPSPFHLLRQVFADQLCPDDFSPFAILHKVWSAVTDTVFTCLSAVFPVWNLHCMCWD
jgi:hypothetical protein